MNVLQVLRLMSQEERRQALELLQTSNGLNTRTHPVLGETYFFIQDTLEVAEDVNEDVYGDKLRIELGVCMDKKTVESRCSEEKLSRLLWKFSLENEKDIIDWDDSEQPKFYVGRVKQNQNRYNWVTNHMYFIKELGVTYFSSEKLALRAINEVCIPFEKEEEDYL